MIQQQKIASTFQTIPPLLRHLVLSITRFTWVAAEEELLESKVDVWYRSKFHRFSLLADPRGSLLADFILLVDTATEYCYLFHTFFSLPRHPFFS